MIVEMNNRVIQGYVMRIDPGGLGFYHTQMINRLLSQISNQLQWFSIGDGSGVG